MPKRNRRRKPGPGPRAAAPATQTAPPPARGRLSPWWGLLAGGLALGLVLWIWLARSGEAPGRPGQSSARETAQTSTAPETGREEKPAAGGGHGKGGTTKGSGGSFLEAFQGGGEAEADGPVVADDVLEGRFRELLQIKDRLKALAERAKGWKGGPGEAELVQALAERDRLRVRLEKGAKSLQEDLARARKARPEAAVPEWLTGELLIQVGGEPDEILPHLKLAAERGLARPRLFASLAHEYTEANRLEQAYKWAARALDGDGQDPYAWKVFTRAATNTERFAEVGARLDRAFPDKAPAWAEPVRRDAADAQARWQAEQKLRAAEAKADDLPRVRLLIEHRRFARDAKGTPTTKVESTGRGEVVVELFEDQAPRTVENFLALVEQKQYDGTRFYVAEPAALVSGGDFGSRSGDPSADGTESPSFAVPDEFARPDRRGFFRGTLGMVHDARPNTANSRFFITFVPMHGMDGRFTAFGRVVRGQDVIDRITLGRTNPDVGHFGRIIPGDLLVRAEVLRKRPHEYRPAKELPR